MGKYRNRLERDRNGLRTGMDWEQNRNRLRMGRDRNRFETGQDRRRLGTGQASSEVKVK